MLAQVGLTEQTLYHPAALELVHRFLSQWTMSHEAEGRR
jgi:hypothetical protein